MVIYLFDLIRMISEKIEDKISELDLTDVQDLSIALMNLVSLEEHSFFSYAKTDNDKYLNILKRVRNTRKRFLKHIVKSKGDSEVRCMSKHLLATSMRLYEVGNKMQDQGKENDAKKLYDEAAEIYWLFWSLNSDNFDENKLWEEEKENMEKSLKEVHENIADDEESLEENDKSIFTSIKDLLQCCIE